MKDKSKKFYKKKSFWVIAAVVVIIVVIISRVATVGRQMAQIQQTMAAAGTSAEVTRSSIVSVVNGSGSLAVAENTEITAPTGIKVEEVLVEVGDTVSVGDTLATLDSLSIIQSLTEIEDDIDSIDDQLDEDDLTSLKRKELKLTREELVEYRSQLNALLENPVIISGVEGVVDAMYMEEGASITKTAATGSSSSTSSSSLEGVSYSDLSSYTSLATNVENHVSYIRLSDTQGDEDANPSTGEENPISDDMLTQINDFSNFSITSPVIGDVPQSSIEETDSYTGIISWTPAEDVFAENTMYQATVVLMAKDGYTFAGLTLSDLPEGWSYEVDETGDALKITAVYPEMRAEVGSSEKDETENSDNGSTGNSSSNMTDSSANSNQNANSGTSDQSVATSGIDTSTLTGGNSDISSYTSSLGSFGSASLSSASGVTGSLTGTSGGYYSNYETAVCVIRRQENVKVTISVDEQDILSVKEGQKATITLDAISDRTFEGTITDVADQASSSSGTAKYAVDITIPMDSDMLLGMSASAQIEVANVTDVLTIPVLALQQSGNEIFVYTQRNEDGTLEGVQSVTTGVSDGDIVEITEGLSEGDIVYYNRTGDTGTVSFGISGPFSSGAVTEDDSDGGNE